MTDPEKMLLACLRREPEAAKFNSLRNYSAQNWEEVLAVALKHRVAPILYNTLESLNLELDIPDPVWEKMRNLYLISAARNTWLYRELLNILTLLNSKGIAVILLKGAHLAEFVYKHIALRPMVDIDLLVREDDLLKVHQVMIDEGYSSDDGKMSCQLHLAPYQKKNNFSVEVHFHIMRPPVSKRVDAVTLWDRVRIESVQGVDALTLCPEDLILHLAAHTCIDDCFSNGLLAYLDVLHTVEHYRDIINWDQLWQRGTEWGIERAVYLMLALTDKILGMPIPEQIQPKLKLDKEALWALHEAEKMIFENGGGVSPVVARMFGQQRWREKFDYFFRRTFPPREKMSVTMSKTSTQNSLKLYWLYYLRVISLFRRHGKIIRIGLQKDQKTAIDLECEIRKNNLRDWLTRADQK